MISGETKQSEAAMAHTPLMQAAATTAFAPIVHRDFLIFFHLLHNRCGVLRLPVLLRA